MAHAGHRRLQYRPIHYSLPSGEQESTYSQPSAIPGHLVLFAWLRPLNRSNFFTVCRHCAWHHLLNWTPPSLGHSTFAVPSHPRRRRMSRLVWLWTSTVFIGAVFVTLRRSSVCALPLRACYSALQHRHHTAQRTWFTSAKYSSVKLHRIGE